MKNNKILLILFLLITLFFVTFLIIANLNVNSEKTKPLEFVEDSIRSLKKEKKSILLLCHSKILNNGSDNRMDKVKHTKSPNTLYNIDINDNIEYLDINVNNDDKETLEYDLTEIVDNKKLKNKFNLIFDIYCDASELFKSEEKIRNLIKNILFFLKENGKCYINIKNIKGLDLKIQHVSDDILTKLNNINSYKFKQSSSNPLEIFLEELNKIKSNNEYSFKYYILDEVYGNDYDINIKNKNNIQSTKVKNDEEKLKLFKEKINPENAEFFLTTFVIIKD